MTFPQAEVASGLEVWRESLPCFRKQRTQLMEIGLEPVCSRGIGQPPHGRRIPEARGGGGVLVEGVEFALPRMPVGERRGHLTQVVARSERHPGVSQDRPRQLLGAMLTEEALCRGALRTSKRAASASSSASCRNAAMRLLSALIDLLRLTPCGSPRVGRVRQNVSELGPLAWNHIASDTEPE